MTKSPDDLIRSRRETNLSPWVTLVEKTVGARGLPGLVFHNLNIADYVIMVARTSSGRFPIIRQFRPAIEQFTWELPGGMLDQGETIEQACIRELQEETGFTARRCVHLSSHFTDTGRLNNRTHAFYVETEDAVAPAKIEPGLQLRIVSYDEIVMLIESGELSNFLHVGAFALSRFRGFF